MQADDIASGRLVRYAYDASGERVAAWQKDDGGLLTEATFYLRDESGKVLSEWRYLPGVAGDTMPSFSAVRDYFYAGDRLVTQVDYSTDVANNVVAVPLYAVVDHLGSTRVLLAEGGTIQDEIEFFPFGGIRSETASSPDTSHLFTGHERDLGEYSSQLDYMHARYYSFNLGRFLSVDPAGGSVGSSQSWNRYSYVMNNPLLYADPTGESVGEYLFGILQGAAGAISWGLAPNSQPASTDSSDQRTGQVVGATLVGIAGLEITNAGLGATGVGLIAEVPSGGTSTVVVVGGGAAVAGGGLVVAGAGKYLAKAETADGGGQTPDSAGKMQKEVERGRAPRDVDSAHNAHNPDVPGQRDHVHFKDGTSLNNDGTVHDAHHGQPNPPKKTQRWLSQHGWKPPNAD